MEFLIGDDNRTPCFVIIDGQEYEVEPIIARAFKSLSDDLDSLTYRLDTIQETYNLVR